MSKMGWEMKAKGRATAGLEIDAAIAPPTKACAVAVIKIVYQPLSIQRINLRQIRLYGRLLLPQYLCYRCFFQLAQLPFLLLAYF